jgi:hypothetical protein
LLAFPTNIDCVDGVALNEKSGTLTMIEMLKVCVREPLTPVMTSGYVPPGVLAVVATVNTEDPVVGFGANVPLAPVGNPLTLKLTAPVNPLAGLTVTL